MASNGKPQSAKNIFQQQPKAVINHQPHGDVWQDKGRISSAPRGTPQPAPHDIPNRPHPLNSRTARSKNRPDPKHKTVHLTLHVDPIVKRELQRLAQQEGLTVSKTGAAFLKQALQHNVDMHYSALLEPIITNAIRKEMQGTTNRLAFLLARNAFTSEQTRNLVTNILGRQSGMTEETLKTILDMTKRTAQGSLTRRSPELEELITSLKEWLAEQEESN